MSRLLPVLALLLSPLATHAHEGHGATPAHVHVEAHGVAWPIDLGLIALALAAVAPLAVQLWRARHAR